MTRISRYPVRIENAAPGKPVRTRSRVAKRVASGHADAAADPIVYLGRALLPLSSTFKPQKTYKIQAGDRLDNLSARLLGDPLLYWMLLEANNISVPARLCQTPGTQIVVPAVGQGKDPLDQPVAGRRGTAAAPVNHTDDSEEQP
jgi:nucleoid-associated protein YgaU